MTVDSCKNCEKFKLVDSFGRFGFPIPCCCHESINDGNGRWVEVVNKCPKDKDGEHE